MARGIARQAPRHTAIRLLLALVAAATVLAPAACSRTTAPGGGGATANVPVEATSSAAPAPVTWDMAKIRGPKPTPGKVMLGSYVALEGKSYTQSVALRREQLGRDQRIVHWFFAWKDSLPPTPNVPSDAVLLISWRGTSYDSITNGSQDAWIARQARTVAAYNRPVFLRWAWEMNGDWYPWGGPSNGNDPAAFVKAWRHVHQIFSREGADSVGWVWNPNYRSHPGQPWNDYDNYYPGDDYVDWVGISGYGTTTRSPEDLFGEIHERYSARKPLMITETSMPDSGGTIKADWIDGLVAWMKQHPGFAALVWFDTNTHGKDQDWRIDTSASASEAYRRLARDPYFAG
jgi:hypothetical protein